MISLAIAWTDDTAARTKTAHPDPSVRGVEPALLRGAAHDAVLRVGDAGRARHQARLPLLLPRRRRRGRALPIALRLAAAAQAGQEGIHTAPALVVSRDLAGSLPLLLLTVMP